MSKIIIEVDLAAENTPEQIRGAIETLKLLAGNKIPTYGENIQEHSIVAAPVAPATITLATITPTAITPAAPAAPAAVELDSEGLPWDARIHATSKKKLVKEGTWKLARKIDPALVETVKAELKATMAAGPDAASVFGGEASALPDTPMQFPELMQAITERMASGVLVQESINAALSAHEIPSLPMLASRPDLIPVIAAELGVA